MLNPCEYYMHTVYFSRDDFLRMQKQSEYSRTLLDRSFFISRHMSSGNLADVGYGTRCSEPPRGYPASLAKSDEES